MKKEPGYVDTPVVWREPSIIASVNIDPPRYAHLLVYEKYCQVVVGHLTSPALDKTEVKIILDELDGLLLINTTVKSKLTAVRYTPSSIKIGPCILLGAEARAGIIKALNLYINDGPYHEDKTFINRNMFGDEVIAKERVGSVSLFSWWDFKRHKFGNSMSLTILGPYERFSYGFDDKTLIGKLANAIECLIETEIKEVKIEAGLSWSSEPNLRVFKQMVCDEPAVCISTDNIMGNQRSLIFISKDSGVRFLEFLKEARKVSKK